MSTEKRRKHVTIEYEESKTKNTFLFSEVALLPAPEDNCAIVSRRLEETTVIIHCGQSIQLSCTVLEGHRFCLTPISAGSPLLSWGEPFGFAIRDIAAGEYVCNKTLLEALYYRNLGFRLPSEPNFEDRVEPRTMDNFGSGSAVPRYNEPDTFYGYQRMGNRGVGTRNYIVLLGLTSQEGSFVRVLKERLNSKLCKDGDLSFGVPGNENISGIVSLSHTEGASGRPPKNLMLLKRTLSGFIVHPNVGAILVVDSEKMSDGKNQFICNEQIITFMNQNSYALSSVIHKFYTLTGNFTEDLNNCTNIVLPWLQEVNSFTRSLCPISSIRLALQCGGSDAFSGVSGNPLAGWGARELIKHGGAAVLAETDELIGAERYILQNCKSAEIAQKFLDLIEKYRSWAAWHGHSAEGNPSGGNKFRGLYNIALKSLGAAMKKPRDVPLDAIVDYGERVEEGGYYMMNSPGNDLESIAGQVASGCQVIYFITGNGSITNFPFVPTIKIVTTTGRYKLLEKDMDVNAGEYLDGAPLEECGKKLFTLTKNVCSGTLSLGEKAGHSQLSIWRDWTFEGPDPNALKIFSEKPSVYDGKPLSVKKLANPISNHSWEAIKVASSFVTDQIGLILPTSLCSSQIALLIAKKLNRELLSLGDDDSNISGDENSKSKEIPVSRFVALPHTEGCGVSSGPSEDLYRRTMLGHLVSPIVYYGVLLEHGCEKTHNDYMAEFLKSEMNINISKFGWASVQLDGGIEAVTQKISNLVREKLASKSDEEKKLQRVPTGLGHIKLAVITPPDSPVSPNLSKALAKLTQLIINHGGMIVIPSNSGLVTPNSDFSKDVLEIPSEIRLTLSYGQMAPIHPETGIPAGLHVMETCSDGWVETTTGLGATGVELMLTLLEGRRARIPTPANPMFPLLRVVNSAGVPCGGSNIAIDSDLVLSDDLIPHSEVVDVWCGQLLDLVMKVASKKLRPKSSGNFDFQIARGVLGISM